MTNAAEALLTINCHKQCCHKAAQRRRNVSIKWWASQMLRNQQKQCLLLHKWMVACKLCRHFGFIKKSQCVVGTRAWPDTWPTLGRKCSQRFVYTFSDPASSWRQAWDVSPRVRFSTTQLMTHFNPLTHGTMECATLCFASTFFVQLQHVIGLRPIALWFVKRDWTTQKRFSERYATFFSALCKAAKSEQCNLQMEFSECQLKLLFAWMC